MFTKQPLGQRTPLAPSLESRSLKGKGRIERRELLNGRRRISPLTSASCGSFMAKEIVLLGATGSIGTQTLDVCRSHPERLRPVGLSAHSRVDLLVEQAREFAPRRIVITDESKRPAVGPATFPSGTELRWGEAGIEEMVTEPAVDTIVAAMVGAAGLKGTIHALQAGKNVALANKETLVVGGPIVTNLARSKGCSLLPIDSEHSAVFQCLQNGRKDEVARIVLTASGGPFRTRPIETLADATVQEALAHPTWNMGPKITIDSATMMNKALEIIEAHWLFGFSADQIDVVIHPQSIVHSMVEYRDGSVIAQVSPPDMRLPIQYALTYPERLPGPARKLNLKQRSAWEFSEPEPARYPALELGFEVIRRGGTSGSALNAANEVAVARFLEGSIRFTEIVPLCEAILARHPFVASPSLEDLLRVDQWARQEAGLWTPSV
jgi:1-deoxy-D-xylulose-5-phosphate reductoisomerase